MVSRSKKDQLDLLLGDLTLRDANTLETQAWRQKYLCWWQIRPWYDPNKSSVAATDFDSQRLLQVSSSMTHLWAQGVWSMYVFLLSHNQKQPLSYNQTTAHFGAQVFGSDIDGRQMRGKGDTSFLQLQRPSYNTVTQINNQESSEQPLNTASLVGLLIFAPSM